MKPVERIVVIWVCTLLVFIALFLAAPLLPINEWKADKELPAWIQAIGSILAVIAAFLVTIMQTSLARAAEDRRRREDRKERLIGVLWLIDEMVGFIHKVQMGLDLTLGADPYDPLQQSGKGEFGFLERMVSPIYFEDNFIPTYELFKSTPINEFGAAAQWLKYVDRHLRNVPRDVQSIRDALLLKTSLDDARLIIERLMTQLKQCTDRLNHLADEVVVFDRQTILRTP